MGPQTTDMKDIEIGPGGDDGGNADFEVVEIAVGGMTCSMCSDAVKTALSNMVGVQKVNVSLATNAATVEFTRSLQCTSEVIQEEIECIGYDVNGVISHKRIKQNEVEMKSMQKRVKVVELAVGGMTCSMCSSAVEKAMRSFDEVRNATVSLSTNVARIEYEESPECTAELLKETVEDIGYDVSDVMHVDMRDNGDVDEENPGENWSDETGAIIEDVGANDDDDRLQRILRQQTNQLNARRRDFLWSLLGALPILTITMVIPRILPPDHCVRQFLTQEVTIFNHPFVLQALILWALATPIQFVCGYGFYKTSYHGISRGILGMDVLVALGTTASYVYAAMAMLQGDRGYRFFETSAVLICFVLLGKWMNAMAVCRTSESLTQLMKLQAKVAVKVFPDTDDLDSWDPLEDSYTEKTVPIQAIRRGDVVKVLKGASIPADGVLIHGEMTVDESMITGESIPVLKSPGSTVLGGTICAETGTGSGALESQNVAAAAFIQVTGVGSSTALSQIVQLVQEAQSRQIPIQNLADYIASIFVPTVVGISFVTFLVWYGCCKQGFVPSTWYSGESPATFSLLFGIACLVISCPCALGLATPTAIMVGTGVGARHGVLMKGGETLEAASKVNSLIFDKTGTLTEGKPAVTDFTTIASEQDIRQLMANADGAPPLDCFLVWLLGSLERNSEHPLATAVVSFAERRLEDCDYTQGFGQTSNFASLTGRGATGLVNGRTQVSIGNRSFATQQKMKISAQVEEELQRLEEEGKTAVLVWVDNMICAVLGIADQVKDDAAAAITFLRKMGVDVWMVTGDSKRTAKSIALQLNLPEERVIAEALPETKVEQVRKLQSEGRYVAMVGDGINDSPALAEAHVGIGMGTGAEIATEASDMVLVRGKVQDSCTALHLCRVIFRRIQWNFLFSMVYNLLGIPLAAGVFFPIFHTRLPPTLAAVAMALSSISVVFSSLALRLYRPPKVVDSRTAAPRRRTQLSRLANIRQVQEVPDYTLVRTEDSGDELV